MGKSRYPAPPMRRLRVYAFDPQASTRLDTAGINVATIKLPWEQSWEEELGPGPVNDYLEVIDVDPVSGQFYDGVDLNDPHLLAQDGLAPSEGDPRFHQQMVFAVAMKTIRIFERALGRRVFWAPHKAPAEERKSTGKPGEKGGVSAEEHTSKGAAAETPEVSGEERISNDLPADKGGGHYQPTEKLRIYPHALREPNAYYSREKKALLFGYFQSSAEEAGATWVFTALSHDIVVHEVTHAILDGLHRRYAEPTSPDSLAFHEAFADIVALFSHFTLEEAVSAHIAAKGGALNERSLLSGLAKQFGEATGMDGALREAIDEQEDGRPLVRLTAEMREPHERGSILVAAVFDAFLTIYKMRTADLLRIAGVRMGQQTERDLHPDLVARLAREASKSAEHVLRMCIRALDYLPPVDVRFGDFLRAIVTADADLVPDDVLGYRLAVIEGFRRRGIVPEGCLSLAVDSLLWGSPEQALRFDGIKLDLEPKLRRSESMKAEEDNRAKIHGWIKATESEQKDRAWQEALGVVFRPGLEAADDRPTISWPERGSSGGDFWPRFEVHSVRTSIRTGPDGQELPQIIVEVTQRRRGFLDEDTQGEQDKELDARRADDPDFTFRGGATLIFDLRGERRLRYAIRKRISDDARLARQREFIRDHRFGGFGFAYGLSSDEGAEPFALVHRGG